MALLGFQWNVQIVYRAPLNWRDSVFPVLCNCWHLYSALSYFQLLLSTRSLDFHPARQESAKDLRVCMKILQPPSVTLFFMDFPWPIFSLSESPEHWSWVPSPAKLPLCLSVSSTRWEVPRINVDLNKCVFLFSGYECSLVPACFWFFPSAFKWLVFIFCPEFVIVTGRRLSLL